MSDKLLLQWNDFKENVNSAFGNLREDKDFSDVTLACEDGHQLGDPGCLKSILSEASQTEQTSPPSNLYERNKVI